MLNFTLFKSLRESGTMYSTVERKQKAIILQTPVTDQFFSLQSSLRSFKCEGLSKIHQAITDELRTQNCGDRK